jgi:hypothetical protein
LLMNIVLCVRLGLRSCRGLLLDSLARLLLLHLLLCLFGGLLLNWLLLGLLGLKLQDLFGSHNLGSAQVEVEVADIRIEESIV